MTRLLLIIATLAGLMLAGCHAGQTPLQQVIQGREIYVQTLGLLNDAHDAGYLSIEQKQTIEPFRAAAAAALDKAEEAALAGSPDSPLSDFRLAWADFSAAMDALVKARLKVQEIKAAVARSKAVRPAATRPVPAGGR